MMPTLTEVTVHDRRTRRSEYQYLFTPKHHGADPGAGQWLPTLSLDEEFAIFNTADEHDLSDDDGRLYSVQREDEDNLRRIGVWNEQVAEFPAPNEGEAWHGYPVYPLVDEGPENRRGEKSKPAKIVFRKMVRAGLIKESQRRRLMKGNHV
jgi:hypothetical protein